MIRAATLALFGAFCALAADVPMKPKAMLKVLCHPEEVALNTPVYVRMEWASNVKRPVAIHLDLLNADTNQWYAGDVVKSTGAAGKVSFRIFVPQDASPPFKWNAYMLPQNEAWPNTLVRTNFTADMGAKVGSPCAPMKNSVRDPKTPANFDYVILTEYPQGFKAGAKTPVTVQYNLMPDQSATYVNAMLMRKADESVVSKVESLAEYGEHSMKLEMDVPSDAGTEPVFLMATLRPDGKEFTEYVAQDKAFATNIYQRKLLRA